MIDDYKIKKASRMYADEVFESRKYDENHLQPHHIAFIEGNAAGFEAGAKWAVNEFINDLWHPASEEPREFAEVLAEAKITESIKTYISFKKNDALFKNWDAYSSGANITRWLYIDDLFPKEGGE
nr:MAG TPA: hypothetical protein [Caudoviricetes sp.]